MAEAPARSITDFKQNVKMPAQGPEGISNEAVVPSIAQQAPSSGEDLQRLVKFYKSIIALVSQYQTAFEKENYNRMGEYVIAINNALTDYFKRDKSEVKTALDDTIKDITKKLSDKVNELSRKRSENALTSDEIKDGIVSALDSYKDKIFRAVTALTTGRKAARPPASGEAPGAGQMGERQQQQQRHPGTSTVDDLKAQTKAYALKASALTIRETNNLLHKQALVYNKQLLDFSAEIGSKIVSSFREILSKVNVNNIGMLQKNLDKMQEAYDKNIFAVVERSGRAIRNSRNSAEQEAESRLKKSLKIALNTLTISLTGIFGGFFLARSVIKATLLIGGKIVGVVGGILNFAKKIIVGAVKILAGTIKFALTVAYKTISIGVKAIKTVVVTTFNLSKFLYNKLQKLVGLDFWTLLGAFVMSYPGAYLLGYLSGRVWRMILHVAGITDEQIASGDYSVKDDVLMPFLQAVKKRFDDASESIRTFLKGGEDGESFKDKIKEKIFELPIVEKAKKLYDSVKEFKDSIDINSIRDTINAIKIFFDYYIAPIANTLWSLIGVFVEGWTTEPIIASRAYAGAQLGIAAMNLEKITKFGRFIVKHSKGGLAAMIAGGVAAGAAAILGQSSGVEEDEKTKSPIKMLVSKASFKELWSKRPTTNAATAREKFGKIFKQVYANKGNDDERKKYKLAINAYTELLNEQSHLENLRSDLKDFADYWDANRRDSDLDTVSLAETPLANDIIYYRGRPLLPEGLSRVQGIPAQLAVLSAILDSRYDDVKAKIRDFDMSLSGSALIKDKEGNVMGTDMTKVLQEVDKYKAYLPEFQKIAGVKQEVTLEDIAKGEGGALKISISGSYGSGLEEMAGIFQKGESEEMLNKNKAWQGGINKGFDIRGPAFGDVAGLGESKLIKGASGVASRKMGEAGKKLFDKYFSPNKLYEHYYVEAGMKIIKKESELYKYADFLRTDDRVKNMIVKVPAGYDWEGNLIYKDRKIEKLSDEEIIMLVGNNELGPNSTPFKLFVLNNAKDYGDLSEEFIKYVESQRDVISKRGQAKLLIPNLNRLISQVGGILAIYIHEFIERFKNFASSKNLSIISGSEVKVQLENIVWKNYSEATEKIEEEILKTNNIDELKTVLFSKANSIFNASVDEMLNSMSVDQKDVASMIKGFYDEKNRGFIQSQVEKFVEEQAMQADLLARVRELINEGKKGKENLEKEGSWETGP